MEETKRSKLEIEIFQDYIKINGSKIYVNEELRESLFEDGEPTDALTQFADIQKLPGLLGVFGLPDIHGGYYFPIGSVAAIDLTDQAAVISPEGVGYDINCGVRCLKTNLKLGDLEGKKEELANTIHRMSLSDKHSYAPIISLSKLNGILNKGMKYLAEIGETPEEDLLYTECFGSLEGDSSLVDQKSKSRGMAQLGSLGSGNHYLEIQAVETIFDKEKADVIGLEEGQILISIHTGSRGLGHGTCTAFLNQLKKEKKDKKRYAKERALAQRKLEMKKKYEKKNDGFMSVNNSNMDTNEYPSSPPPVDEQPEDATLFVPYFSMEGKKYMKLMYSAANFAWANRSVLTQSVREAFDKIIPGTRIELISDVCHNIAKIEDWQRDGKRIEILVHRKGASRILPPGHPDLHPKYKNIGQPVLLGGSMGTSSFLVTGAKGCEETFYSSAHGAGRLVPRIKANKIFKYDEIVEDLRNKGIMVKCDSQAGLVEESGDCYKDVEKVIEHSDRVGITVAVAKLRPVIVIKGD